MKVIPERVQSESERESTVIASSTGFSKLVSPSMVLHGPLKEGKKC